MVARCKPLTKDHLLLKTAFAGTKGRSVVTGFTVFKLQRKQLVLQRNKNTTEHLRLLKTTSGPDPARAEFRADLQLI